MSGNIINLYTSCLESSEPLNLGDLLRFITGVSAVPPMGLTNNIKIDFLEESPSNTLPKAQACFYRLSLPVVHSSFESFRKGFMTALNFGGSYGSC